MLELDKFAKPRISCPLLLDPASYFPDTEDLTVDEEAREYWLHCFVEATEKVILLKCSADGHKFFSVCRAGDQEPSKCSGCGEKSSAFQRKIPSTPRRTQNDSMVSFPVFFSKL
jgi:hypothetical protein